MKLLLILASALLLAVVLTGIGQSRSQSNTCPTGEAHGFVSIVSDPPYLVGTIPSSFQRDARYFSARYNCRGLSVEVRRVDEGMYDVRFPGLKIRLALADAVSDEGVSTSYFPLGNGIVRVVLRGPLSGEPIAVRRDVPFSVLVF